MVQFSEKLIETLFGNFSNTTGWIVDTEIWSHIPT